MKFIHRLAYFSVGLFFGIVILIFFLGGKRAACDYTPNDRVLKNLRTKPRAFSEETTAFFTRQELDTAMVSRVLKHGKVDFERSNPQGSPCNEYLITGELQEGILELQVKNCDSLATFTKARLLNP